MADENKPYGRYTGWVSGAAFFRGANPSATADSRPSSLMAQDLARVARVVDASTFGEHPVVAPDHTPPSDARVQRAVPIDFNPYEIWNLNSPAAK